MKTLVVIPAKNEEKNIVHVLRDIKSHFSGDILVVDDFSDDRTYLMAKSENVKVIRLLENLGAWGAINAGFKYAEQKRYDAVITMDADGQHLGEYVPVLLSELKNRTADLVIGSFAERLSKKRKFVLRFFKMLTGLEFNDLTSGFRAYSKKAFKILGDSNNIVLDYQDIGVLLICRKMDLTIVETEVIMRDRLDGKSRVFASYFNVLRYIIYSILWSVFRR